MLTFWPIFFLILRQRRITLRYALVPLGGPRNNTKCSPQEVLQVYSDVRRPRSQRILDLSTGSGRVGHGYGPSGFTKEGLQQDYDVVETWQVEAYARPLNEDVDKAIGILKETGVFV